MVNQVLYFCELLHDFLKRELRPDIPPERFTHEIIPRYSRDTAEIHPELARESFLLQNDLHHAAMEANAYAPLYWLGDATGVQTYIRMLMATDAFGFTPSERAHECYRLSFPSSLALILPIIPCR